MRMLLCLRLHQLFLVLLTINNSLVFDLEMLGNLDLCNCQESFWGNLLLMRGTVERWYG